VGAKDREVGTEGKCARSHVHYLGMRDVAVGENHLGYVLAAANGLEVVLWEDGDAVRIGVAGQLGGVAPTRDSGDLRGSESDDRGIAIVAVHHVEVVEVAARGAADDDAARSPGQFALFTRHCATRSGARSGDLQFAAGDGSALDDVLRQAHVLHEHVVYGKLDRLDVGNRQRGQHAVGDHQEERALQELLEAYLPVGGVGCLVGKAERHLAAINEVHREGTGWLHRFSLCAPG
jgi:hypothetical protein